MLCYFFVIYILHNVKKFQFWKFEMHRNAKKKSIYFSNNSHSTRTWKKGINKLHCISIDLSHIPKTKNKYRERRINMRFYAVLCSSLRCFLNAFDTLSGNKYHKIKHKNTKNMANWTKNYYWEWNLKSHVLTRKIIKQNNNIKKCWSIK